MKNTPVISVICPVLNEIGFIDRLLKYLVSSKPFDKECIFADGGSTDGTRQVIEKYVNLYPEVIKLINNPHKYVPHGLNLAVKSSKGRYIVRIDAHSVYDTDYFEQILKTFEDTDADIVGGPRRPAGNTNMQRAIAKALASGFGSSNGKFRKNNLKEYEDYGCFGAWKHEIFESIGYFDEELIRNEDEDFHYRAKNLGLKIYLNPDIRLWYYPRSHIKSLFNQYYGYGYFKPVVGLKSKSEIKIQHIIPPFFTTYLILLPIALVYWKFVIPLIAYFLLVLFFSVKITSNLKEFFALPFIFPAIHLGYGFGYMTGLPRAIKRRWDKRKALNLRK